MPLPDDFIYKLKTLNPIDSVMSQYVNLMKRGHDFICNCPFHSERTASCHIYMNDQHFYCFGCGAGGDVITFIERIENLSYIETVKLLAEKCGLNMPNESYSDNTAKIKAENFAINRETANFYFLNLVKGNDKRAINYLISRGLTPATIKKYGLGFAPDSWHALRNHLRSLGYNDNSLVTAGVCKRSQNGNVFDMFRNRVIFPILDLRGNVVAFGGRVMDNSQPKYLNTSDTPVFKKSRTLFSLNYAKNSHSKRLLLAEGYMDVISLNQAGFTEAVATLGTAITPEHARIMKQYANEVIICYDSDNAGRNASHKAINILSDTGIVSKVIDMQGAKDPDEYIKKFGADKFKSLIENSNGAINFELMKCRNGLDINSATDKVQIIRKSIGVLAQISDTLERNIYIHQIAAEFKVDSDIIKKSVEEKIMFREANQRKIKITNAVSQLTAGRDNVNPESAKHIKEAAAEEQIIHFLLKNPDCFEYMTSNLKPENFVTSFNRRVFEEIAKKLNPENFQDFSPSSLRDSGQFTQNEMNEIYRILSKYEDKNINKGVVDDCIKILKNYNVNNSSVPLTNEELLARMADTKSRFNGLKK